MTGVVAAFLAAGATYVLPGLVWTRRTTWSAAVRLVVGTALATGLAYCAYVPLGLAGQLNPATAAGVAVGLNGLAWFLPARSNVLDTTGLRLSRIEVVAVAIVAVGSSAAALSPPAFFVYDAIAVWVPQAEATARTGGIPDPVTSVLQGFPPSVSLLAGAPSVFSGNLVVPLAELLHPMAMLLTLTAAVLIARVVVPSRLAGCLAVLVFVSTPLLGRSVQFHDDYVAALFVGAAAMVALRGSSGTTAAAALGIVVGAVSQIKFLGALSGLLVIPFLSRGSNKARRFIIVTAFSLVGITWFAANSVRFGNPTQPFLAGTFGGNAEMSVLMHDHLIYLRNMAAGGIHRAGWVALVLVPVGVAASAWAMRARRRSAEAIAWVGIVTAFVLIWASSPFAARHLLLYSAVFAGLGGSGLCVIATRMRAFGRMVPALTCVALATLTAFVIVADVTAQRAAPGWHTGVSALVQGKDSRTDSPRNDRPFGGIQAVWQTLDAREAPGYVFSFDTRAPYRFPLLPADDLAAFPVYRQATPALRHRALLAIGVRYIITRPSVDRNHELLYSVGPWQDIETHPEWYRLRRHTSAGNLYEVRGLLSGTPAKPHPAFDCSRAQLARLSLGTAQRCEPDRRALGPYTSISDIR